MTPRQIERRRAQLFKLTHGAEFVDELARLALKGLAAEKVVEAASRCMDRLNPDVHVDAMLIDALAAYDKESPDAK